MKKSDCFRVLKNWMLVMVFSTCMAIGVSGQHLVFGPVKVFLLAGQSNMDGCGKPEELPEEYRTHPQNITTWDNKNEKWVPLGEDSFAEQRNQYFGPEIAFSHQLAKAFPKHTIAIIKTSGGGTMLWKHWLPGKAMYKRHFSNINKATQDLKDRNVEYEICGMLWMQGESDSETEEWANAYEDNLRIFFDDVRFQTGKSQLPIVMGRISSSILKETPWVFDYAAVVQNAQDKVADLDKSTYIVHTDHLKTWTDNTHFDGDSQIWLGSKMGEIMIQAINK